jgi:S-DNA-T family DNA segregation ATPase FtsK/SpoIIIE
MAPRRSTKDAALIWGVPAEKWREISAFILVLLALLLLLSLISSSLDKRWIGTLGSFVARQAAFVLGRAVSYVLPALLLLAAFHAFGGRTPFHPVRKTISGLLILFSLCALVALPHVLRGGPQSPHAAFEAGGLLGNFLTSDGRYGLRLVHLCGPAGAYLLCLAALIVGAMLSTDFLFVPLVRSLARTARSVVARWRRPPPVATLHFGRDTGQRVFPVIKTEGQRGRQSTRLLEGPTPVAESEQSLSSRRNEMKREVIEGPAAPSAATAEGSPSGKATARSRNGTTPASIIQTELDFNADDFELPSIDLFTPPPPTSGEMDREEVLRVSGELEAALADFNISARVVAVTQGPVVTRYELQPAPGIKVSRILNLENDIALILKAKSVRIQAPIPGKAAVGVEVPNRRISPVYFRDLIETDEFREHHSPLAFVLGKNISGEPVICDLSTMPHLLIAGTTGSGKSVCVNSIVSSMLCRMPPGKLKLIMIDPKRVELNVYSEIPHLIAPVVNEPRQAAAALMWAVQQMEERLRMFSELRVRNIDSYNAMIAGNRSRGKETQGRGDLRYMPHIVIVIDELADLMLIARNEVEEYVVRLAQMSRAAGIHLIIATQRPSVNVLTGIIKANFPSRIAFRVSAKVDSRTILDMNGAETLLGRGDMLFSPGGIKPMRIQGAYISDEDVEQLTDYLRSQTPAAYEKETFSAPAADMPDFEEESDPESEEVASADRAAIPSLPPFPAQVEFPSIQMTRGTDDDEELYDRALRLVLETRKPSVSMIQRRLKIGFARAGRLMDLMEERGIVGPYLGSKPRDLIVEDPDALLRRLDEIGVGSGT